MQHVVFQAVSTIVTSNVDLEGHLAVTPAMRRLYSEMPVVHEPFSLPDIHVRNGTSGLVWSLRASAQPRAIIAFYDGEVQRERTSQCCMAVRLPKQGPRGNEFNLFYIDSVNHGSIGSMFPHGDKETCSLEARPVLYHNTVRLALCARRVVNIGEPLCFPHYESWPALELRQDAVALDIINKPPNCRDHSRGQVSTEGAATYTWRCCGRFFPDHATRGGAYNPGCQRKTTKKLCFECAIFYGIPIAYCDECFHKHKELLHAASSVEEMPSLPQNFTPDEYEFEKV